MPRCKLGNEGKQALGGDGKKKTSRGGVIMGTCVEGMQNMGTKRKVLTRCSKLSARKKWGRKMVDEGTREERGKGQRMEENE